MAPFLMGSLSLDTYDNGKNVLEIGLGGGSVNMALMKMKPEVRVSNQNFVDL